MSDYNIPYFEGESPSENFSVKLKNGTIYWSTTLCWDCIFSRTLKCGNEHEYELKQEIGFTSEQYYTLESEIMGNFGLKGLSELQTKIKELSDRVVRFSLKMNKHMHLNH